MKTIVRNIARYPSRIPQIYGTIVTLVLILYFFIIYAIGFIYVTELRVVNLLIQVTGIYLALKQYRRTHQGQLDYLRALSIGVGTSFIASSTFVVFLFFYLNADQELMNTIRANAPLGEYLDPYIASFSVWLEGIFSGFLASFIIINYIRTDKA